MGEARELMIRGQRVVVRVKGTIETVSHDLTCEWCCKTLRPTYHTDRQRVKIVRRTRNEEIARERGHYQLNGTNYTTEPDGWFTYETSTDKVTARTFQNSFGSYGDNIFCGLTCARNWALAAVRAIIDGRAVLRSVKTRQPITFHRREKD
jgi:hypothetical protein